MCAPGILDILEHSSLCGHLPAMAPMLLARSLLQPLAGQAVAAVAVAAQQSARSYSAQPLRWAAYHSQIIYCLGLLTACRTYLHLRFALDACLTGKAMSLLKWRSSMQRPFPRRYAQAVPAVVTCILGTFRHSSLPYQRTIVDICDTFITQRSRHVRASCSLAKMPVLTQR